jgi:MoaA/NifB/PqqE/SkfB family radical SAM enzyme
MVLKVYRPDVSGLVLEREVTVEAGWHLPGEPLHLYWRPIENARGIRFYLVLRQKSAIEEPIKIFAFETSGLVHSPPQSNLRVPFGIGLSPATQCNLNCVHCVSRYSRKRASVLPETMWDQLAAYMREGFIQDVTTDYSGDIFYSDQQYGGWLRKIIEEKVGFRIDTHANNLTEEYARLVIQSRLRSINFSIDTLEPDKYKIFRKGGKLDVVVENLRRFMTIRNRERPNLEVIISFTLTMDSLETLRRAVDLAAELNISLIHCNHLVVWTDDMTEQSLMLDRKYYARINDEILELAASKGVAVALPVPNQAKVSRRGHAPCPMPWFGAQILGNGDVMACCLPGTKVGNLHEQSLEAI